MDQTLEQAMDQTMDQAMDQTMANYTFKASKCDWECLSKALRKRCDIGRRRIPWCRPASLLCDVTGDCDMQCDDNEKLDMPLIEMEGLKTFFQAENILCKKGEVFEISSICDQCDLQVKIMRFKLPRRRRRLPCTDIKEILEQDQIEFDCVYKVCDCQTEYENRFISNCRVTNIEKGRDEISNKNPEKRKKGAQSTSPPPEEGVEEGLQEEWETATFGITTTSRKNKKGKGKKPREGDEESEPVNQDSATSRTKKKKGKGKNSSERDDVTESVSYESTTSRAKKKKGKGKNSSERDDVTETINYESTTSRAKKKKGNGKNSGKNDEVTEQINQDPSTSRTNGKNSKKGKGRETDNTTTSGFSTSDGNVNDSEETSQGNKKRRKHRKKGYNSQCHEYETTGNGIGSPMTTASENIGVGTSETTLLEPETRDSQSSDKDRGQTTTDPANDVSGITIILPKITQRTSIIDAPDKTKGEKHTTTDVTSGDVTEEEKSGQLATQLFGYRKNSGVNQTDYVTNNESYSFSQSTVNSSGINSAFITQQPETGTLPRSGLAFHDTTMFNFVLAGSVAGLVLIFLVIMCIVLFVRDRKQKKRMKLFADTMNLPPPPPSDVPDDEGRAVFNRKSSMRLSVIMRDHRRSSAKMKSFSLKKIDPADSSHI